MTITTMGAMVAGSLTASCTYRTLEYIHHFACLMMTQHLKQSNAHTDARKLKTKIRNIVAKKDQ